MKILEAFDLTGSYKAAARLCGCSHVTVADYVARRARGQLQTKSPKRRPSKIDPHRPKIEEWISRSKGNCQGRHLPSEAQGDGLCRIRAHGEERSPKPSALTAKTTAASSGPG